MATLRWLGRAAAVAQVTTVTVGGTVEIGDRFLLTVNGKTLSVSATSTSTSTTASEIVTAWNALDEALYPEFARITASVNGSGVVLTADDEGVPFTVTAGTTESDGGAADAQTFVAAATAAATGPWHWDNANNWDAGAIPANGDTVYLEGSDAPIYYGLDQSAVTLAALHVRADYTGTVGLPEVNTSSSASYPEYREQYLKIGATSLVVGAGDGQGSGRLKINNGSVQTAALVYRTSQGLDTDIPALLWKGTHADNTVSVFRGEVGIAFRGADAATVATLLVGYETGETTDSRVNVGSGTTLTTFTMQGGSVRLACAATTITKNGGELTVTGSGAYTTISQWGGLLKYLSSGTVTNLFVGAAEVDFRPDMRARTVSNCDVYAGAVINDPQKTVAWTNGVDLNGCDMSQVTLNLGRNIRLVATAL